MTASVNYQELEEYDKRKVGEGQLILKMVFLASR